MHPPLGYFSNGLLILLCRSLGLEVEFGARLLSAILGTLTGVWSYAIFTKLSEKPTLGLVSACFFLFYPPYLAMNMDAHFYTAVLSFILMIIFLISYFDPIGPKESLFLGIVLSIFLLYDFSAVYFALVVGVFYLLNLIVHRVSIRSFAVFMLTVMICAGWFYAFMVLQPVMIPLFFGSTSILEAGFAISKPVFDLDIFWRIAVYQIPPLFFLVYNGLELNPIPANLLIIALLVMVAFKLARFDLKPRLNPEEPRFLLVWEGSLTTTAQRF